MQSDDTRECAAAQPLNGVLMARSKVLAMIAAIDSSLQEKALSPLVRHRLRTARFILSEGLRENSGPMSGNDRCEASSIAPRGRPVAADGVALVVADVLLVDTPSSPIPRSGTAPGPSVQAF